MRKFYMLFAIAVIFSACAPLHPVGTKTFIPKPPESNAVIVKNLSTVQVNPLSEGQWVVIAGQGLTLWSSNTSFLGQSLGKCFVVEIQGPTKETYYIGQRFMQIGFAITRSNVLDPGSSYLREKSIWEEIQSTDGDCDGAEILALP